MLNCMPEWHTGKCQYVRFHFTSELELLKKINYPKYSDHKSKHDILIKQIFAAAEEFNTGEKFVPNHFVRTLKDWVFSHIAVEDRIYADYVAVQKNKGLLSDKDLVN